MQSSYKVLLTGGSGQLGQKLQEKYNFIAPSSSEFDFTDEKKVEEYLEKVKPDIIFHAGAYTNTSLPDKDSGEAHKCFITNVIGTRNIAQKSKCPIIYISSESVLHPYNFYSITKLQGEKEIQKGNNRFTIARISIRYRPFEYDMAFDDMLTIADYDDVIADRLLELLHIGFENKIVYVGTGVKTIADLAKQTKPNIKVISRLDVGKHIPAMTELLNV